MVRNLIKMPSSKFYRVMCKKCRQGQIVYSKVATVVKCLNCGAELANPTGGEAHIKGKVLEVFG